MKKILLVATYVPPAFGVGTVRVTKFAKYLSCYGYEPVILTISEKFITKKDYTLFKDIENIKTYRLDFDTNNKKNICLNFYKKGKHKIAEIIKKENIEYVYITGGPFEIFRLGRYVFENFNIPYILDFRDPWKLQKLGNKYNIKTYIRKIRACCKESYSVKKASAILTVNDTMTNDMKNEYKTLNDKIYTITNGYDEEDYEDIEPMDLNDFTIIYAGKFGVAAGFRDPTAFFKELVKLNKNGLNIKFKHIGIEEEKVISIAKEVGADKFCEFLGLKGYKETISYCKGADILLLIGGNEKCEQTGKIFDYIACKKNVIALTIEGSEINKVTDSVSSVYRIEKNDGNMIYTKIKDLYESKSNINIELPDAYKRKNLTKDLAKILDSIK